MYTLAHFAASQDDVRRLLGSGEAADLVTPTAEGLVATMLPLLFDEPDDARPQGALVGHVARSNPHWQAAPTGESMAIVRGPDAYITPSWYATKREHGRVVPTWNYETVHVHGALLVHDDVTWLDTFVRRLTDYHESREEHPWSVDDAPERYVAGQLRAIVGVELVISRVEAKVKMSQNRATDVDGVIAGLDQRGDTATADAVRRASLP